MSARGPAAVPDPSSACLPEVREAARAEVAAPYGFDEFEGRAARRRASRATRRRTVALAAVCLLLAAGIAPWLYSQHDLRPGPAQAASLRTAARAVADQHWLNLLPPEPAVVSVETRMVVVALEDRIAWIDDTLSASSTRGDVLARIHQLETERARLVDTLVRVRYAEQLAAASR